MNTDIRIESYIMLLQVVETGSIKKKYLAWKCFRPHTRIIQFYKTQICVILTPIYHLYEVNDALRC